MIDNKELIKPLLDFTDKDDFFMLYIFKRKKDHERKENVQSVRTIKTYCIHSIEHLEERYEEIKALCEYFKARAYIHVQRQNHKDVGLNMMVELATRLKDGATNQRNLFDSIVGQLKVAEKRWVVDVDDIEEVSPILLANIDHKCEPFGSKCITIIPTRKGFHIITKPFNVETFKKLYPNIDVQKKNPTILYYPNSLK